MDEIELSEWRRVRDAADADALAHLCGDDTMGTETGLRAELTSSPTRWSGLHGMIAIHLLRAGQAQDPDWREAHQVAVRCYRDELRAIERAIRDALGCMSHADDTALATTVVTLCRVRGGQFGVDLQWIRRAVDDLGKVGATDGVRILAREWLAVAGRAEQRNLPWLRRGVIAPHEMPDEWWRALRAMWQAATSDAHRHEVTVILQRRAIAAIEQGDFHELYVTGRSQYLVTGEPFAAWLQLLFDQAVADDLTADLLADTPRPSEVKDG